MASSKVAIVTGANKGIGYAIVKGLCERYDGKVYLTARDNGRGVAAVNKLKELGFNPVFHQLDIGDEQSIKNFEKYLKENYGGIDLLINNAGHAFSNDSTVPFGIQAEETVKVNYFDTLKLCNALFPLLRENGRVVNISSSLGHLSKIPSETLRTQLSSLTLTVDGLNDLMNQFVTSAKNGKNVEDGWGSSAYNASKVGFSAVTIIQQRNFDNETTNRNISVNSVHPGYVDTDMTNHKGVLTIEEGASAPLYLALENHGLKGQFVWRDNQVVDWCAPSTPTLF